MELADLLVLSGAAFATAVLTAVAGLGGGVLLLAVLLIYLEPVVAIPVHGVIQLVSNASRTWIQRRHVARGLVARYAILLVPASWVGLRVVTALPARALRLAIGGFVLLATWWPRVLLLGMHPGRSDPRRRFLAVGALGGFANVTIGAAGPLIGPFFRSLPLPRQGVVGTFAACQTLGHAVKVALFGAAGFAFFEYATLMAVCCVGVVLGTALGSRLLERVSEASFQRIYRLVLTLVALRIILGEILAVT